MFRTDGKRADGLTHNAMVKRKEPRLGCNLRRHLVQKLRTCHRKKLRRSGGQSREKENRPLCPTTVPVPICPLRCRDTGTNRGSRPEIHPRAGRTTPSNHGRTTGDDLANPADQSRNSTRKCSQRISNHPPKLRLLSNL
jgi:hypothetical protein